MGGVRGFRNSMNVPYQLWFSGCLNANLYGKILSPLSPQIEAGAGEPVG